LLTIPFFMIDALYTRGAFKAVDAHATALALQQYGWGVPAFVLAQITNRAFFARQDTATPMRYALISVGVNVVAGIILFHLVGVPGIAAATSLASWLNVIMMSLTLARRGHYALGPRARSKLVRILAASIALGLLLAAAGHYRPQLQGALGNLHLGPIHAKEIVILLVLVFAGAIYPMLLFASGGITMAELRAALRRPARIEPADIPTPLP
jgi:putative peptidoglycan lipid II flippase